jgi:hypothetical protein
MDVRAVTHIGVSPELAADSSTPFANLLALPTSQLNDLCEGKFAGRSTQTRGQASREAMRGRQVREKAALEAFANREPMVFLIEGGCACEARGVRPTSIVMQIAGTGCPRLSRYPGCRLWPTARGATLCLHPQPCERRTKRPSRDRGHQSARQTRHPRRQRKLDRST